MDNKRNLYVITHCQSCYNKHHIFTGLIDSVLTPDGHKHAQDLAQKLRKKRIGLFYTSPLTRSKQTLQHIKKYHPEAQVIIDKRIIERDYGELSGKSQVKYKREYPELYPIYHRSYDIPPPGGESIKDVEKRIKPFIQEVISRIKKDKVNVLIVTHGNAIRPIRKYFEDLTNDQMMKLEHQRHKVFKYQIGV
ncbi:histidine phosphatase family protein [Candidatus Woesebacteria bacterium]|nr:histidine phosphatase family protein [Candidatus Woesebacteria bacterium]